MLENILPRLVFIIIVCVGVYVLTHPATVAERIKRFYSNYPFVRYAGEKQLTARLQFVRVLGVVFIIVGILGFFSV